MFYDWGRSSFHPGTFYFSLSPGQESARPPPTPPSLVNASTYAYIGFLSAVAVSFKEGKQNCRSAPEAPTDSHQDAQFYGDRNQVFTELV